MPPEFPREMPPEFPVESLFKKLFLIETGHLLKGFIAQGFYVRVVDKCVVEDTPQCLGKVPVYYRILVYLVIYDSG